MLLITLHQDNLDLVLYVQEFARVILDRRLLTVDEGRVRKSVSTSIKYSTPKPQVVYRMNVLYRVRTLAESILRSNA